MELLEGRTLQGILAVRQRIGVYETIQVGKQLCDALAAAHAHAVMHRDVRARSKPPSRPTSAKWAAREPHGLPPFLSSASSSRFASGALPPPVASTYGSTGHFERAYVR